MAYDLSVRVFSGISTNSSVVRRLTTYNLPSKDYAFAPSETTINVRTPWGTDLWKKPPAKPVHNHPYLYTTVPLSKFHSAKVKVSAKWVRQYDQGGLAIRLLKSRKRGPKVNEEGEVDVDDATKDIWTGKWIKTGIEYEFGQPNVGTVATYRWSDWSLVPLPADLVGADGGNKTAVTVEIEREVKKFEEDGVERKLSSLWVYMVDEKTQKRSGIREVTWLFEDDLDDLEGVEGAGKRWMAQANKDEEDDQELWVGVYAARPKEKETEEEELVVGFENFEIRLFEEEDTEEEE